MLPTFSHISATRTEGDLRHVSQPYAW